MASITKTLKDNKDTLSVNTIKTYSSLIRSLCGDLKIELSKVTPDLIIKDHVEVIKHADTYPIKRRKTLMSALLLFCKGGDEDILKQFRNIMVKDMIKVRSDESLHNKTDKQKEAWVPLDDLKKLFAKLEADAKPLFKKDAAELNKHQFNFLSNFITMALYMLQLPRRSTDYTEMKIAGDIDKTKDNWIDWKKKEFVFCNYKTKSSYGIQRVPINPTLLRYMKDWMKFNKSDWLLVDSQGKKMNSSKLTQRLSSLVGKEGFGVNLIRHIVITDGILKDNPMDKLKEAASEMGHSIDRQQLYKIK